MKVSQILQQLEAGTPQALTALYAGDESRQRERYCAAAREFQQRYGDREVRVFSVPGRTEVGGNHTDHNHGRVLAGSVGLDVIAFAAASDTPEIRLQSQGHRENRVSLSELTPVESERETSNALIRGICARFQEKGYPIGGVEAYTTSEVLSGSGLSSSAAFEVLVCTILAGLYGTKLDPVEAAQISQYAENVYFGKPCGLMDQTACAVGGLVTMDFADPQTPEVRRVNFDFSESGYRLCITSPGDSHAGLSSEYAAITVEMGAVASAMGARYLREIAPETFYRELPRLRGAVSDRALLRASHFYADHARVAQQVEALEQGNFDRFLELVRESGRSSFMYLQNVYCAGDPEHQGISLALAISDRLLGSQGAYRIHGGGFAGTIQAFVPERLAQEYRQEMDRTFGPGSCKVLSIRAKGCTGVPFQ